MRVHIAQLLGVPLRTSLELFLVMVPMSVAVKVLENGATS